MRTLASGIRIIFFSDTHLGLDYPVRGGKSLSPHHRGPDFFRNFQTVIDYARQSKADLLVHGGDLFFRSKIPEAIVDMAYQPLFECASHIPVVIVPGNHERSMLPSSLFLTHSNIHVFTAPQTFHFSVRGTRIAISGFPFARNIGDSFKQLLASSGAATVDADIRLLCLHQSVQGAVVGPFRFRCGAEVISACDIPAGYNAVLSGHIHGHQRIHAASPVIYSGSIERTSFAEKDETKGFCELLIHEDSTQLQFHPLETRPMIDYTVTESQSDPLAQLADSASFWSDNSIVRLHKQGQPRIDMLTNQHLRSVLPEATVIAAAGLYR
jgi:DNA repair protein SbcD/Mre11